MDDLASVRRDLLYTLFAAYDRGEKATVAAMLSRDFRFTSPYDRGLDADAYFRRCWPEDQRGSHHLIRRVFGSGDRVGVTYEKKRAGGGPVARNTEVFT